MARLMLAALACLWASAALALDDNPPGKGELFWSAARKAAKDDAQCQAIGAKAGTALYVQCRLAKDQQRAEFVRGQIAASQGAYRNFNANRPRNCTSQVIGTSVYTNCF